MKNMKAYQVMIISGVILILLGLYGFLIPKGSYTSLISTFVGLIVFILAFPTKKENSVAAHIAIGLTILSSIAFYIVGFMRGNAIIIIMASVGSLSFIFYVFDFIVRKKQRAKSSV